MIQVQVSPASFPAGEARDLAVCFTNTGQSPCMNITCTIRFPPGVIRLGGRDKIVVDRLAPGESNTVPFRVQAVAAGDYQLTSANFSYRDHRGEGQRVHGFAVDLAISEPRGPAPEPRITAEVLTGTLPYDEWSALAARITNHGDGAAGELEVAISGQVVADRRNASVTLPRLPARGSEDIHFFVRALEAGRHVPVHLDLAYRGPAQDHRETETSTVWVVRAPTAVPGTPAQPVVKILFLAANPAATQRLRLDEEAREIRAILAAGKARDSLAFSERWAVRGRDITQAVLDVEPRIIHFAGHGADGSIVAEHDDGSPHVIPPEGLAQLFQAIRGDIECVVVNACSTERLAFALAEHVPYVVAMRQAIGDRSAIFFSVAFYQALAAGRPLEQAFDIGKAQLTMMGAGTDQFVPLLLPRDAAAGHLTRSPLTASPEAAGRVEVAVETECSPADRAAVEAVFADAGIRAAVRVRQAHRSASDLPSLIVLGFSAWAGGTFLKSALEAGGDEAGRSGWRALMRLVKALQEARTAAREPDSVSLSFPEPTVSIILPPGLPPDAYRILLEKVEPQAVSGVLMWDSETRDWVDAATVRSRCDDPGCRESATQERTFPLPGRGAVRRKLCDKHAATGGTPDFQTWA